MTFETGPYLSAAFVCEKVLNESDGVKSAIRIIDRVFHRFITNSQEVVSEPFDYQMTLFLRFKAGSARGPIALMVRLVKPSGESPPTVVHTLNFEGEDDRGWDMIIPTRISFDQAGLYWFDVFLGDQRVTRIPFKVIYNPMYSQTSSSGPPPPALPGQGSG